jgi:Plavaka transposase
MTTPRVTMCGDGHFRRIIYGIGPYIADYPEQALLACVIQGWCPKSVLYIFVYLLTYSHCNHIRCSAPADQLDSNETFGPRSHMYTEALTDTFSLQELWDGYGIVGDVTVCIF